MRVCFFLLLSLLLAACSDTPTETKTKEPEKPSAPITGRQAFQSAFPAARVWAADCQPLRIRSINLAEVKSDEGKAGAWEIFYVSPGNGTAKIFTWSAAEADGNLHKGVFKGQEQSWSPSGGQERPIDPAMLQVDTPAALKTATTSAKDYLDKPGTKPPVNFLLEYTPRFPDPVWRVLWGQSVGVAEYTVFVDATTGKAVGKG
jgi:hypothetical protein